MAREENPARSYAGSEIQVLPAAVLPGHMQRGHIGQRRQVEMQRMPPHKFIHGRLTLIVEPLNCLLLSLADLRVPFALKRINSSFTPVPELIDILTLHVITKFTEQPIP